MKQILFLTLMISTLSAQTDSVISGIYKWNNLKVENINDYEERQILKGRTTDEENLNIYALTIKPGKSVEEKSDDETLIIIKEGSVKVFLKDDNKILVPGSIVLTIPGDEYKIENSGDDDAVFYIFLYRGLQ